MAGEGREEEEEDKSEEDEEDTEGVEELYILIREGKGELSPLEWYFRIDLLYWSCWIATKIPKAI